MTQRMRSPVWVRTGVLAAAFLAVPALQGCATAQNKDPIEPWNRKVFAFNESVDTHVLKPVAEGYNAVTPEPVRTGVRNFFGNLRDVWSAVNLFLQGRMKDGAQGVMRVAMNSTFGIAGLIDIATPMRLERFNEDFGQTLGVWGVGPGAYIVWPLLGPSTLRDSVSIPGDLYFSSVPTDDDGLMWGQVVLNSVSLRASLLNASSLVDDVALDKYAFLRDAYLQRRQNLIYEGDPPDEEDEPEDEPQAEPAAAAASDAAAPAPAPAAAASAASAP